MATSLTPLRSVRGSDKILHRTILLDLGRQRSPYRGAEAADIETEIGQQFAALGVLDEAIGQAEADDVARVEAGAVGRFQHGAAEAAFERAFLDRDDQRQLLDGLQERGAVERLGEAGVDDADVEPFLPQLLGRLDAGREQRAEGDQHAVVAPFVDLGLAQLDRRRRRARRVSRLALG